MILHMEERNKKRRESLQEPYFLLLQSKGVSGSLETNLSGKIALNSCKDPPLWFCPPTSWERSVPPSQTYCRSRVLSPCHVSPSIFWNVFVSPSFVVSQAQYHNGIALSLM